VTYYSTNPVNMQMIVSPQIMVSRDVSATSSALLMARVMDVNGNPVQTYQGVPMNVTFSLQTPDTFPGAPSGGYTETSNSSLSATTANMASNGFATVNFIPGTFATSGQTGYNATATGQINVTALWISPQGTQVTSKSTLIWKNYPYLSIISNTSSSNTVVGGNVTLTITINGNGAALQPKPIDVELCIDRSGSMLEGYSSTSNVATDKMIASQAAATNFSQNLHVGRDRIGIVSFGDDSATHGWANLSPTYGSGQWNWGNVYGYDGPSYGIGSDSTAYNAWAWVAEPANGQSATGNNPFNCGSSCPSSTYPSGYDTTATHWQVLSANFNGGTPKYYGSTVYNSTDLAFGYFQGQSSVQNAMQTIVPAGGTSMRYGLWSAISQLIANPPTQSGTVRAVILQTDGEWNTGGDPDGISNSNGGPVSLSGPGTGSVLTWAAANGIKVFTIGIGSDADATELQNYATETGGTYYAASDQTQLSGIYATIAGQLIKQAGGNTTMVTNFGSISVGGASVSSIGNYMNYVYSPPVSTYVSMYNTNPSGTVIEYAGYPYQRNDTLNWTQNQNFTFNIGTMVLNDTWQTTFIFSMLQNGTYTLFGPNTNNNVVFNDSSTGLVSTGFIPSLLINVVNTSVIPGMNGPTLQVNNLIRTDNGATPNLVGLQWNTTYTGTSASGDVLETVYYKSTSPSSQWSQTSATVPPIGGLPNYPGVITTANIDTSSWAPGTYWIEVVAEANNAASEVTIPPITYTKSSQNGAYIKLE
jgi:hypothetical protein